jgi:ABC-type microcin C transport system duplicated ATPase subunit YejF
MNATWAYPIPDPALDDRLAFIGTSGSGKTYNAGSAVEKLAGQRRPRWSSSIRLASGGA